MTTRTQDKALADHISHKIGVAYTEEGSSFRFSYGNAFVLSSLSGEVVALAYHKEGEITESNNTVRVRSKVFSFVEQVLATGRTVEVGRGVGLSEEGARTPVSSLWSTPPVRMSWRDLIDLKLTPPDEVFCSPNWDKHRQARFISDCLNGVPVTPLLIHQSTTAIIIDGKQRLSAVKAFMSSSLTVKLAEDKEVQYRDFNEIERRSSLLSFLVILGKWDKKTQLLIGLHAHPTGRNSDKLRKMCGV